MLSQLMFRQRAAGVETSSARSHKAVESALPPEQAKVKRKAPLIGVLGAKGGTGSSTLALNLSLALGQNYNSIILVDADFRQPDLGQLLALEPEHTLRELIGRGENIDEQVLNACCLNIAQSNCRLLSPPEDGSMVANSNLSELSNCLSRIKDQSDIWLVDLPKQLDKHFVTFVDSCDKIVLVFEATLPAVAACRRWLRIFSELGYASDRIVCVLNRAGSKHSAVEKQMIECFQDQEVLRIPNASSLIWDCSTTGVPALVAQPKHAYSKAVNNLAAHISYILR